MLAHMCVSVWCSRALYAIAYMCAFVVCVSVLTELYYQVTRSAHISFIYGRASRSLVCANEREREIRLCKLIKCANAHRGGSRRWPRSAAGVRGAARIVHTNAAAAGMPRIRARVREFFSARILCMFRTHKRMTHTHTHTHSALPRARGTNKKTPPHSRFARAAF